MIRIIAIIFMSNVTAYTIGYWKGCSAAGRAAEKIIDALRTSPGKDVHQ